MKGFKKMPKMACGNGVKKYADGGAASNDLQDLLPSNKKIGSALKSKLDPKIAYAAANPVGTIGRHIAKAAQNTEMPKSYETEKNTAAIQKAGEMGGIGYKKGGRTVKKVGTVKKYKAGGKVKKYSEGKSVEYGGDIIAASNKPIARGQNGPNAHKDPDIFTPTGKYSTEPIPTDVDHRRYSTAPIPLSPLKSDLREFVRAMPTKKRGGKVTKKK